MEEKKISYSIALALSAILGKCTIKSISNELFFPVIKLKAQLSGSVKKFHKLKDLIYKDLGIVVLLDGSYHFTEMGITDSDVTNMLVKTMESLSEEYAEVQGIKILSENNLRDLHQENISLTTGELEILMHLVH